MGVIMLYAPAPQKCSLYLRHLMVRAVVIVLFFSCAACLSTPDCIPLSTNEAGIEFKNRSNQPVATGIQRMTNLTSGIDYTLAPENDTTSYVRLPMSPDRDTTALRFVTDLGIDTIVLTYTPRITVISPECGALRNFNNLRVVYSSFDSVRVINPSLRSNIRTHVEIVL